MKAPPQMIHQETPRLALLPRPVPSGYGHRLCLYVLRRMATAGVNDAHAVNAMIGAFGRSYRRPLVLMRAMMLELARSARHKILVAPCCCARMTGDEAALMQAIGTALAQPDDAFTRLTGLLRSDDALGALTCLQAVAQAHADLGRPLDLYAG